MIYRGRTPAGATPANTRGVRMSYDNDGNGDGWRELWQDIWIPAALVGGLLGVVVGYLAFTGILLQTVSELLHALFG